jgi:heptosyltransferase-1
MKILVVKTSSLGDIIHTLPAVRDAAKIIPSAHIDWVVEEAFQEIPEWHLNVCQVIPVAWRRWRRNWRQCRCEFGRFKRSIQQEHYDKVIDAQGLIKSGMISLLARGERIGLTWSSLTEPLARLCYQKAVRVNLSQPAVYRMRSIFAKSLGYSLDNLPLDYGLQELCVLQGLKKPYVFFCARHNMVQ